LPASARRSAPCPSDTAGRCSSSRRGPGSSSATAGPSPGRWVVVPAAGGSAAPRSALSAGWPRDRAPGPGTRCGRPSGLRRPLTPLASPWYTTLLLDPFSPGLRLTSTEVIGATSSTRHRSDALLSAGSAEAEIEGPAASYRSGTASCAMLPARSVQLPVSVADALAGPEYVTFEQPATPDVASVPPKANVTGWLYQPC